LWGRGVRVGGGGGGGACVNHGLCAVCDRAEFRVVFVYNVFLAPINCAGALRLRSTTP